MKNIIIIIGIFAFLTSNLQAQVSLQPGDLLPDVTLRGMQNYPTDTLKLSELRGKLVILDFWDVSCSACIKDMPNMEALQEQFKDQIQIILVTSNTKSQVEMLAERSSIFRNVKLPMFNADSIFTKLFVFRTVPTHVWIDKKGIVNQFTGAYSNSQTVGDFLLGKTVTLPLKREYRDFNPNASLFEEGGGRQRKHVRYYSSVFGKIDDDGGSSNFSIDTVGKTYRQTFINCPILYLYQYANAVPGVFLPDLKNSRVIIETSNNNRFSQPSENDAYSMSLWNNKLFGYELFMPLSMRDRMLEVMRRDLELYFGLKARKEFRNTRCIVVRCSDTSLLYQQESIGYAMPAKNFFDGLLNTLAEQGVPVMNELGYEGKINIKLEHSSSDREGTINELERYGITLHWEERELEMLIITD